MRKVFLILTLLMVSVLTTACINNFAVQELNNKAKIYLEKGDTEKAISRLKSSLDLDDSIFETHYNLAIAYMKAEEYNLAKQSFEKAKSINDKVAELYYSIAVCDQQIADIAISNLKSNDDNSTRQAAEENHDNDQDNKKEYNLSLNDIKLLLNSSIENYQKYIELEKNNNDKEKIEEMINDIKNQLNELSEVES